MKISRMMTAATAALLVAQTAAAAPQTIDLAGNDHTGYFAISRLKSFGAANTPNTNPADPNNASQYPFFADAGGVWRTIAAAPLSASSVYSEEASFTVLNKTITDPNFNISDIGDITFDNSLLSGVGVEVIAPANFSLALDATDFSPRYSTHNTGTGNGNFSFDYLIAPSNIVGSGLTFNNGSLVSIDFTADIAITSRFSAGTFVLAPTFNGTLTLSGDSFAYNVDVTQNSTSPFVLTDLHLVANRAGSLTAVVPEPTAACLAVAGLLGVGLSRRRS